MAGECARRVGGQSRPFGAPTRYLPHPSFNFLAKRKSYNVGNDFRGIWRPPNRTSDPVIFQRDLFASNFLNALRIPVIPLYPMVRIYAPNRDRLRDNQTGQKPPNRLV